jgi:hypothetical protein
MLGSMGELVEVDVLAWPLIVIRMPSALDSRAIESFMRGLDEVFTRRDRFVAIVDTTRLSRFPNAIERRQLIVELDKRTFAEQSYNMGNAVVIVSAAARAVLTAINWVRPPIITQHIVSNFRDALEWCSGRLVLAGIGVTPRFQALLDQERVAAERPPLKIMRK